MAVYIPVYDRKWSVISVNADDIRRIGRNTAICNGYCYCADVIYTTESAAYDYIAKNYYSANKHRLFND